MEEEERRRVEEEAAKAAAEADFAQRRQRELERKRETLPTEPQAQEAHVKIAVQLPDGRVSRLFRPSDRIQDIYDYVDLLEKVRGLLHGVTVGVQWCMEKVHDGVRLCRV